MPDNIRELIAQAQEADAKAQEANARLDAALDRAAADALGGDADSPTDSVAADALGGDADSLTDSVAAPAAAAPRPPNPQPSQPQSQPQLPAGGGVRGRDWAALAFGLALGLFGLIALLIMANTGRADGRTWAWFAGGAVAQAVFWLAIAGG